MYEHILVESGDIATLTVNRPENLNSLNVDALHEILDALSGLDARALVVTGAGDRAFVAGADIRYVSTMSVEEAQEFATLGNRVMNTVERFEAPVIAAVNGYALGGGCELALACDFRVASENAVLGQTEIDLGIIPGWGGTQRLPRLVGDERARRMIYLGERLNATEALEAGLVGEVIPQEELYDRVYELAEELAGQPRFALSAAKEAINHAYESSLSAGLEYEQRAWSSLFGTEDQREGMKAFLEKREPEFK